MKSYPSITTKFPSKGNKIIAFDKLDGSNIRVEWSKKRGFYKFGTRNRLLDESDPVFGESKQLIIDKYEEDLVKIFREQRWEKALGFFEFGGENSFAGTHQDEEHDVILFDVHVFKKGMVEPKTFRKLFEDIVETPKVLYQGNLTSDFVDDVKDGSLTDMTFEGVVCKWEHRDQAEMCKVKSRQWLDKLKTYCKNDPKLFNRL
jgi:hypothetical protein